MSDTSDERYTMRGQSKLIQVQFKSVCHRLGGLSGLGGLVATKGQTIHGPIDHGPGKRAIIDDLDLSIYSAERLMIIGPNGAGKSTILKLGHGLLAASSGEILCTVKQAKQSFMFQRPVLLRRSVLANLSLVLELQGTSKNHAQTQALQHLESLGLASLEKRAAPSLSGGEQQSIALARAMLTKPSLLWLDEPTSNLDPGATRSIEQELIRINNTGTTLVMVAHDLSQARRLADRVALVHLGRLIELSEAAQFFREPTSQLGRKFLSGELL